MSELPVPDLSDITLQAWLDRAQRETEEAIANIRADVYKFKQDALAIFTYAAYGSMRMLGTGVAFPDLGAGWQKINLFDSIQSPGRHVTLDLANDSFSFDSAMVVNLSISLSFQHNSVSNTGRITNVRLFDETTGIAGNGVVIGTGRNSEASLGAATIQSVITPAQIGDQFIIQIGGGDTYSSVQFSLLALTISGVGEYQGAL